MPPDTPTLDRLMRPRAIAVVGASPDPGAVGGRVLAHLRSFGYAGAIYPVNPNRTTIDGLPCVPAIDALPMDVDAVVLAVPQPAVADAIAACVRRRAGAAVIFASGFAEADGGAEQQQIAAAARAGGLMLVGPNCMGLANYVDRAVLSFGPTEAPSYDGGPAVAVVAQSGGIAGHVRVSLRARGIDVSHAISTGNEAGLCVEDFLDWLVDDPATRAIAVFAEQLRRPPHFLAAARRACALGKPIVMLHTGRSQGARAAALTHTGAITGDHAVMRVQTAAAGVVLVDSLEELVDAAELLLRFPAGTAAGPAIVTDSGAFKSFALDFCDSLGLALPALSPETATALAGQLPPFVAPGNPLDITTQGLKAMELYGSTSSTLLDDPGVGGLIAAILPGTPAIGLAKGRALAPVLAKASKPVAVVAMGGDFPVADELIALLRQHRIAFWRSPERALRAFARIVRAPLPAAGPAIEVAAVPLPAGRTAFTEHESKAALAAAGIAVPRGRLVRDRAAAQAAAAAIGYPVAFKAQAATLTHKSDAGAVILDIADAAALTRAWAQLQANVAANLAGLKLDGVLVEAMAAPGLDLVVGARRDPDWGAVLMIGLGGIWVEALNDIALLPIDSSAAQITGALRRLRAAPLLAGARGTPPADLDAVAAIAARVGALMTAMPQIDEIDINPVRVYRVGQGAVALDALIVAG